MTETRGRKPIHAVVQELRGNPGGRPIPDQIHVDGDIGDAPDWFTDEERAVWAHVVDHMPPGLLTILDKGTLIAHCVASAMHKEATLEMRKTGAVVESPVSGTTKRSEWFMIQSKASEIVLKTSAEMGMTPASRTKVSAGQAKKANKFTGNGKRSA